MVAAHEHFDVNVVCFLYDWFHTKTTKFQLIGICDKRPCHGSGTYSPDCHHKGPDLCGICGWQSGTGDRFYSMYFRLHLLLSFHRCSLLIQLVISFILCAKLLAWNTSIKSWFQGYICDNVFVETCVTLMYERPYLFTCSVTSPKFFFSMAWKPIVA